MITYFQPPQTVYGGNWTFQQEHDPRHMHCRLNNNVASFKIDPVTAQILTQMRMGGDYWRAGYTKYDLYILNIEYMKRKWSNIGINCHMSSCKLWSVIYRGAFTGVLQGNEVSQSTERHLNCTKIISQTSVVYIHVLHTYRNNANFSIISGNAINMTICVLMYQSQNQEV